MRKVLSINPLWFFPAMVTVVLGLHASTMGITDDEAYYWVLAQKWAWGYAYHPPMVAWIISFFENIFPPFLISREGWLRLPAVLVSAYSIFFSLIWLFKIGVSKQRGMALGFLLLAFPGLYGASWMMVPDIPLLLSWWFCFYLTWKICFRKSRRRDFGLLVLASAFAVMSKLTAVLFLASSALCFLIFLKGPSRWKPVLALALGTFLGLLPFLIWNSQNAWGPILYQLQERHHGGGLSWIRYLRFWVIILFAVGPPLAIYFFRQIFRTIQNRWGTRFKQEYIFLFWWTAPSALVFCIQPAFSDFKPHWALLVWLPVSLTMAIAWGENRDILGSRIQRVYAFFLLAFVFTACHWPLTSWLIEKATGRKADPRWDVSNDSYGWDELPAFLDSHIPEWRSLPVLGSRYQTASQAAFALKRDAPELRFARIPRSEKEWPEWPEIAEASHAGPDWPKLSGPVIYVADNRYSEGPGFPEANCQFLGRLEKKRDRFLAKEIKIWKCP